MIKLRKKVGTAAPDILVTKGREETRLNMARYDAGSTDFSFDSALYGHKEVKEQLIVLQDCKCCFCESTIGHISYGDVEHFRPKAGWVQDDEPINKPGYYWLAYEWSNLLLSCQLCNQRYKRNFFPLLDEACRARNHHASVGDESPRFIHPETDDPEHHITFNEEIPKRKNKSLRGEATIEKLGLDRELLNEQRRRTLEKVRDIYELARDCPTTTPAIKDEARAKIKKYQLQAHDDRTEYASMLRCFFQRNPIDF